MTKIETVKVEVKLSKPFVEVLENFIAANRDLGFSNLGELLEDMIRRGWEQSYIRHREILPLQ
jgi:hypothetical protein